MKLVGYQTPTVDTPDMTLVLVALSLLLVGLVAISSASIEYAQWHFQNPWYHSQRHLVYLLVGLIVAVACFHVRTEFWLSTGWWWLFGALALLILVLIPGVGR